MSIEASASLFRAIEENRYAEVKNNLKFYKATFNIELEGGTAIEKAAELGHFKLLKLMAKNGATLRPSQQASISKARQIVLAKLHESKTLNHLESEQIFTKIHDWLVAEEFYGLLVSFSSNNNALAFDSAIKAEHTKLFDWIIGWQSFPRDKIHQDKHPMEFVAEQGCLQLVKHLAKKGEPLRYDNSKSKARGLVEAKLNGKELETFTKIHDLLCAYELCFSYAEYFIGSEHDQTAFETAIKADYKPLFSLLLRLRKLPNKEVLGKVQSSSKICKLLEYSPSKKFGTVLEAIGRKEKLEAVINDEALTSDEESSDEEDDPFISLKLPQEGQQVLYRGVHFSPQYFNSSKRKEKRKPEEHSKAVYSLATLDLADKPLILSHESADQHIKSYFTLLKLTPDKAEIETDTKRTTPRKKGGKIASYPNLYERFVQAYVTSYEKLFNEGGMQRNFNFYKSINPMLSTSRSIVAASHFGGGHFIAESARYFPKVRSSTRELKHRRLGYLEIYSLDKSYLNKHTIDIQAWMQNEKIGVDFHHQHANEIAIESSIPSQYIVGYQMISLPSMKNPWSDQIFNKYGLSQQIYKEKKQQLKNPLFKESALKDLIERVVEFQANKIENSLKNAIENAKKVQDLTQMMTQVNLNQKGV